MGCQERDPVGRGRGRPPAISEQRLVDTARQLGPDRISLQSVGEMLGVARTSLYYHVGNTEELGRKVLEAIIDDGSDDDWLPGAGASWEHCLRAYAEHYRGVLLRASPWLRYGRQASLYTPRRVAQVDRMIGRLSAAGFSVGDASAALGFVSQVVHGSVRPEDDYAALRGQLEAAHEDELPWIRRGLAAMDALDRDAEFRHNLERAIAGIRACRA